MLSAEVHPDIHIGDRAALCRSAGPVATVHACKEPCFRKVAGRPKPGCSSYLFVEREDEQGPHLYLNMIDPPGPNFPHELFARFLAFASAHYSKLPLRIHCNQGHSRAPSLGLLFLAKRLDVLPNADHAAARGAFQERYPAYNPGRGIELYLTKQWGAL